MSVPTETFICNFCGIEKSIFQEDTNPEDEDMNYFECADCLNDGFKNTLCCIDHCSWWDCKGLMLCPIHLKGEDMHDNCGSLEYYIDEISKRYIDLVRSIKDQKSFELYGETYQTYPLNIKRAKQNDKLKEKS
jgi:hypothetical protein